MDTTKEFILTVMIACLIGWSISDTKHLYDMDEKLDQILVCSKER